MSGFTSEGLFPLISVPTRITDTTATLIDNIWTNNLTSRIGTGSITVRVSDHLPIFAFVGGTKEHNKEHGTGGRNRLVNGERIEKFAEELKCWSFDEARALGIEANVAKFRNEFRDMYDTAFPWVENKKRRKDEEKPWLDDLEFKGLVGEKGRLYKISLKGALREEERKRLAEVSKEVNKMRLRLKRDYFEQRLNDKIGDLRHTWEVIGEALNGRKSKNKGSSCKYFEKSGVPVTDGSKIAQGFCDFYCQVGPRLASKIPKEHPESFKKYLGDRIIEPFILRPTTAMEIEEVCLAIEPGKGMGWDGVSPRVIKGVARELAGSLSRLFNCCMREGYYPSCF